MPVQMGGGPSGGHQRGNIWSRSSRDITLFGPLERILALPRLVRIALAWDGWFDARLTYGVASTLTDHHRCLFGSHSVCTIRFRGCGPCRA